MAVMTNVRHLDQGFPPVAVKFNDNGTDRYLTGRVMAQKENFLMIDLGDHGVKQYSIFEVKFLYGC